MPKVVIVGGGIAGLSASYELRKANVEHILIERRPRLGGVIETRRRDGCVLEAGPDSFISQKPEALALIKELGMSADVIDSNDKERRTYIQRHGKLVQMPEGVMMIVPSRAMPMLKSPLLGLGTKLKMALELLRKPSTHPDRSIAEFVADHFGEETVDYLAEPLLSGVYGGDPRQLSVDSVLPRFVEMERKHGSLAKAVLKAKRPAGEGGSLFKTLKSGLGTLVDKLAQGAPVRTDEVEALEQGRVRVGGEWVDAQQVILACPAYEAAKLTGGELGGVLSQIPYSSSVTVSLAYRKAEFNGMYAGHGFLVPRKERKKLGAATFAGTKFLGRIPDELVVIRCFFGGDAALEMSDADLQLAAAEEMRPLLGLTTKPVFAEIARWPRAMAQYTVGHASRWQRIQELVAQRPGLHLAGNAYTGIGIPDCIRMGRQAARTCAV